MGLRDNHGLAYNFAKCSPILIFFTDRLGNKSFLIWLLTTPSHLKYVAALVCTLSLIACFLTLMFFTQGSMATYASVLGILITTLLQIYYRIFQ